MKASVQDGAFSWLLCVACFLNCSIVGGFVKNPGMFYLLFKNSLGVTDSEASLITSVNTGVMTGVSPFVGMLSDHFGSRHIAMVGTVLSTSGLALSALSTQVHHMVICYGFITGVGQGMVNINSVMVTGAYFNRYRRMALTLVLAGGGAGSFILPPVLNFLQNVYGWRGAILLLAGLNAHTLVTSSLFRPFNAVPDWTENLKNTVTLKSKVESSECSIKLWLNKMASLIKSRGLEMLSLFKIIPYLSLMVCTVILMFATSMILTHFGSYLLTLQFTSEDVVKLYMVLGVSATVARPIAGLVAELTHVNMAMFIMLTLLLVGALTLFVPIMHHLWMIFVYATMFQLLLGPYLGLGAAIIMEYVPKAQVPTAYGLYVFVSVPGFTLGAPIATWLYDYTQVYGHTFYLAGVLILLSGLTMAPAAYYIHKKTPQV